MEPIKIELTISDETIIEIFETAMHGGSNYWYWLSNGAMDEVREKANDPDEQYFSRLIYKALQNGAVVEVHDIEDMSGEPIGVLSLDKIKERIQELANSEDSHHLFSEINGSGDASSSDVVFQYMCMGEVVYG